MTKKAFFRTPMSDPCGKSHRQLVTSSHHLTDVPPVAVAGVVAGPPATCSAAWPHPTTRVP